MPRRATRQQQETPEMPATLIPPSEAEEKDKAAYWIGLLAVPEDLKAATETTDFFILMQEFPAAVWDRLAIYLYRLPDDNGMLIKNSDEKPHYIKVLHQPLTEEFVAKNWGGGKYQAYLKLDNKEVLRKHTFRIDGIPKMQPGQQVEIEGKTVPIAGTASAPPAEPRTDIATVIEASADANRQNMEILAEGSKAAIQLVKDQSKPETTNPIMDKLLTVLVERIAAPPAPARDSMESALTIIEKLDAMAARRNPAPVEPEKTTPLEETLDTIKSLTGADSIADLLKPTLKAAAADPTPAWVGPLLTIGQQLVAQIPAIMHEARINRDLEFRRMLWLRTAQPGATPPAELTANNPAPAPAQPVVSPNPPSNAAVGPPTHAQLAQVIVRTIIQGFDKAPKGSWGEQTAETIDWNMSEVIESLGVQKWLADPETFQKYISENPGTLPNDLIVAFANRAADARWKAFEEDFLNYTTQRWGEEQSDAEPEDTTKSTAPGPQPIA